MLISAKMNDLMNAQIGHELGASLQYIEIAAYCDGAGLPVLTKHFFAQAAEEREHALKFVRYVLDADGSVAVPALPAPRAAFKSAEEAVALALEWEHTVTKQINALLELASTERDYLAHDFLEWFAREQLEECASMDTLLKMVRRAGESQLLQVENALAGGRALTSSGEAAGGS
ncbi:MAG TPA: ferritin [Gemmatimonadales bacterium]|nr:ferritin [Gemmatimonadales bacterium]